MKRIPIPPTIIHTTIQQVPLYQALGNKPAALDLSANKQLPTEPQVFKHGHAGWLDKNGNFHSDDGSIVSGPGVADTPLSGINSQFRLGVRSQ